jgi:hypothetical protein
MDQSALLSYFCQKHDGSKEGCKLANPQAIYQNKVIFVSVGKFIAENFHWKKIFFHSFTRLLALVGFVIFFSSVSKSYQKKI